MIVLFGLTFIVPGLFAQTAAPAAPQELIVSPSLSGGVLVPFSAFSSVSTFGGGFEAGAELNNLFFKQSVLKLIINYNFISENLDTVNSFGQSSIALLAGYSISLADGLSLTPLIGGGYMGHFVSESSVLAFFDPQLRFETDLHISLAKDFYLFIAPTVTVFFEKSNTGAYFGLNLGIATSFHIPLSSGGSVGPNNTIYLLRDRAIFSPNADGKKDTIRFVPDVTGSFENYELRILDKGKQAVRVFRGGNAVPKDWKWDGKTDNGTAAADGEYTAELVLFQKGSQNKGSTESFTLDTKPIAATLAVNPKVISPDSDGAADTSLISINTDEEKAVVEWSIRITDPAGNLFREVRETAARPFSLNWDGRSVTGELVQSAMDYGVEARLADAAGNITLLKDRISTDILVQRSGNRLKVIIPSILFEGNLSDYKAGPADQVAKNIQVLDQLAVIFKKYPGYKLVIEGYAINMHTDSAERMAKENREELLPLSQKRAEAIRDALVERGLDAAKIKYSGKGNADPVVPLTDKANQWKNRRVEFILEK
jgi:outer membrane protein OmpA-like peptidoglycan-associated protein